MNDILISVIIPVYNAEEYIARALESVLNQTYEKLDIIVVDDGSDDNSLDICKRYAACDKRIKLLHKQNGGQASARTYGIKRACGDYITFLDADDYIDVETYANIIKKTDIRMPDVIAYNLIEEDNEPVIKKNKFIMIMRRCKKTYFHTCCVWKIFLNLEFFQILYVNS